MRSLRSAVLTRLRSGSRTVLWVPDTVHLGNVLYHWLQAHRRQSAGDDVVVRRTPAMSGWLDLFPAARDRLTVRPSQVRFRDRRELGFYQSFGLDFDAGDLSAFCTDVILPAPFWDATPSVVLADDEVALNVRRGDFYSDPVFRARYSFDIPAYVGAALTEATRAGGPIPRVHVVSDDIPWCREHLGWISERGPRLTFASPDGGARDDFLVLASTRRLIVTTSTFGYWAAYVSGERFGTAGRDVVAPWFHQRNVFGGAAYQLHPGWTVVTEIPGSWGPAD